MVASSRIAAAAIGLCAAVAFGSAFVPSSLQGPPSAGSPQPSPRGGRVPASSVEVHDQTFAAADVNGEQDRPSMLRWLSAGLVAGIVAAAAVGAPAPVNAEIKAAPTTQMKNLKTGVIPFDATKLSVKTYNHLEQCGKNKKYAKRIKDEAFKLKKRQDKYAKGSAAWLGVQEVIDQAKVTAKAYEGRWCGKKDGLPRVIATGEYTRGGIVTPGLMFLYTAGWIGYAGRSYLLRTKAAAKEFRIDVPLALTCMTSAFAWPVYSWQDITAGKFIAKDTEIKSPMPRL